MSAAPKFATQHQRDFVSTLHQRINQHFKETGISRQANTEMNIKSVVLIAAWIGIYCGLMFGGFGLAVSYLLWASLGVTIAMLCVNVGHDAIHGSYSNKGWLNKLLTHIFNLNGASAYMWTRMHNVAHHTYTNVEGFDEDIEPAPILRLSPYKPKWKIHRFQHLYAFFLYGLSTLSWVFAKDYVKFFQNTVGNFSDYKHPKSEYFFLFFYKFCYYGLFIVVPAFALDFAWYHLVLGFLLMHYLEGMYLAVIFMLAHVVEETHFPIPDRSGTLENSWAVHQLYTTANFAPTSWWASALSGGLNQQIEHHLFPNMCSIHYRKISPIVKQTAEEFGFPYYELTFTGALKSHVRFLKRLGRQEMQSKEVAMAA